MDREAPQVLRGLNQSVTGCPQQASTLSPLPGSPGLVWPIDRGREDSPESCPAIAATSVAVSGTAGLLLPMQTLFAVEMLVVACRCPPEQLSCL